MSEDICYLHRPDVDYPTEDFPEPLKQVFDAGVEACVPYIEQLETQVKAGQEAIDLIRNAPRAVSAEADFDAMTWTFQIRPDCRTGGGTYALVWVPNGAQLSDTPAGTPCPKGEGGTSGA